MRLLFRALDLFPPGFRRWLTRLILDRIWAHYIETRVTGLEQIPDGPCLYICNHLSNADAVALWRALRPRQVYFLAGIKLEATTMTRVVMGALDTIPIRPGSPDVEALKRAVESLRHGKSVLIFPEGTRSRTGALIRGRKGAGLIAKRSGAPIVPIGLTGTEQFLPINDKDMGGEKPRHAQITVTVGKPFRLEELEVRAPISDEEDQRQLLVDAMMLRVAALLPPAYQGVYGKKEELAGN